MGQNAGAARGTLLLIGSGALADSLAKVLRSQDGALECAPVNEGVATARVLAPDLILLAGDAAQDRGAALIAQLARLNAASPHPVLVVCAPELGGLAPQAATPRHVGFLSPEGGVSECARRMRAVVELFVDEGLAACTLQQLIDTVAPHSKPNQSTAKLAVQPPAQGKSEAGASASRAKQGAPAPIRSAIASASAGRGGATPGRATAAVAVQTRSAAEAAKASAQPAVAVASEQPLPKAARVQPAAAKPESKAHGAQQPSAAKPARVQLTQPAAKSGAGVPANAPVKEAVSAASKPSAGGGDPVRSGAKEGVPAAAAKKSGDVAESKPASAAVEEAVAAATAKPSAVASAEPAIAGANPVQAAGAKASEIAGSEPANSAAVEGPQPKAAAAVAASNPKVPNALPKAARVDATPVPATKRENAPKVAAAGGANAAQPKAAGAGANAAKPDLAAGGTSKTAPSRFEPKPSVARANAPKPNVDPAEPTGATIAAAAAQQLLSAALFSPDVAGESAPPAVTTFEPQPPPLPAVSVPAAAPIELEAQPASNRRPPPLRVVSDDVKLLESGPFETELAPTESKQQPPPLRAAGAGARPSLPVKASPIQPSLSVRDAPPEERELAADPADVQLVSMSQRPTRPPALPSARAQAAESLLSFAPTSGADGDIDVSFSEPPPSLDEPQLRAEELQSPARQDATPATAAHASKRDVVVAEPAPPRPARTPLEPAVANAPSSKRDDLAAARSARNPLEPAVASAPSSKRNDLAAARSARNPLEPAVANAPSSKRDDLAAARSARNPLEPAVASGPSPQGGDAHTARTARNPLEPAPSPRRDDAAAARPARNPLEPVVASAPSPQRDDVAATAAPPRAPRNPLEPANPPPRRARNPLEAPAQWPAAPLPTLEPTTTPRPARRGLLAACAVAAIGCGVAFHYLHNAPARPRAGAAAMGSLQRAAIVPGPSELMPTPTLGPRDVVDAPSPTAAPDPTSSSSTALASRSTRSSRPDSAAHDAVDSTSDAGRARALVDEGSALMKQGRLGLAESSYQKALQLVPEYPSAMAALVRVHLARRDGAEALRWAKRLVAKQPDDAVNQLLLGDALARNGELEAARDAWTLAARRGNSAAAARLQ